ncbi:hypothetical protein [Streptomyces sp. NPDC088707]|uniref:hypothetical protein n=1 Tax=Streptomyces sp. NPDC088707 TaxID=3365871 RepID=UPI00382BC7D4
MAFAVVLLVVHAVLALLLWHRALFSCLAILLGFFAITVSVAGYTTLQQQRGESAGAGKRIRVRWRPLDAGTGSGRRPGGRGP